MNTATLFHAILIAAAFVGWPIIGNYSKTNAGWIGTTVVITTALTVSFMSSKQLGVVPDIKSLIMLSVAGIINGIAVYFYSAKIANSTAAGLLVVMVSIFMVMLAPIFDWAINGKILSLTKISGIGMGIVAIYLLSK